MLSFDKTQPHTHTQPSHPLQYAKIEFWHDPTAHTYPAVHFSVIHTIRVGISGNAAAIIWRVIQFKWFFDIQSVVSEPPQHTPYQSIILVASSAQDFSTSELCISILQFRIMNDLVDRVLYLTIQWMEAPNTVDDKADKDEKADKDDKADDKSASDSHGDSDDSGKWHIKLKAKFIREQHASQNFWEWFCGIHQLSLLRKVIAGTVEIPTSPPAPPAPEPTLEELWARLFD